MIRFGVIIVSIALFVLPAAAASEIAPVLDSMAAVLDMAYEIERYSIQHGRLPAAKSRADLSQVLLGTDSMTALVVDAWGTPLHIDSDPDSSHYIVASAGADREFDREQWWAARAATTSAADDIVIRNGEMVRWPEEWVLARFRAEEGDAARVLEESLERTRAVRTLADMMAIRTAVESYASEHGALPAALPPGLPGTDGWGRPFAVMIDRDAKTYRVVSAGADGRLDEKRWSETGETRDYARDAVLRNGEIVASWQTRAAAPGPADAYAGFLIFKTKLAGLRLLGDAERRKLRLEGLGKDMDAAVERQDYFGAMNLYEEAEKLGVRDTERLRAWALNFTLNTPLPPGQPEPPRLIADARNRAAAGRIAAALRRALAEGLESERWPITETLADLERERGETEVADQLMEQWSAANPGDVMPRLRQLSAARRSGDTARVLRLVDQILTMEPSGKDALYATGLTLYEVVAKSGDALPAARKRGAIAHGRRMLERAAALDPGAMEPLVYLSLILRQQALLEPDAAKSAKLVEEADAIRNRAIETGRRRRAGS